MNLQYERIQALCQTLSLPLTAQGYAAAAQQAATDQLAYSDFLEQLLRAEPLRIEDAAISRPKAKGDITLKADVSFGGSAK